VKHGILALLVLFLGINSACANDFKKISDDSRIILALQVLKSTESSDTLESLFTRDKKGNYTKIIFYDLGMISYEYKKHYAMACKDNFGENYIIISTKYRNAPKEALAALIAHEAAHRLEKATLDEEVSATLAEVKQWNKSLAVNSALKDSDNELVKRLNNLCELYNKDGEKAISQKITGNGFYKAQFDVGSI